MYVNVHVDMLHWNTKTNTLCAVYNIWLKYCDKRITVYTSYTYTSNAHYFDFWSGPNCSLPSALDYIGLSDIMTLVQFMCLCATGKVLYPQNCQPRDSAESLGHLTTAIGTLVQDSPASLKQLIQLCTQVGVQ